MTKQKEDGDFTVVASMGHIRDLPIKSIGVDIENNFEPDYWINDDKKKTVNSLLKLAKTHPKIWIATDEDREWEAIGWHLCHILKQDPLIVEKEREIQNFKPVESWKISIQLKCDCEWKKYNFKSVLTKIDGKGLLDQQIYQGILRV